MALINNDDIMRKCISQRVVKWNSTFDEWKPPSNKQSLGMSQLDSHLHFLPFFHRPCDGQQFRSDQATTQKLFIAICVLHVIVVVERPTTMILWATTNLSLNPQNERTSIWIYMQHRIEWWSGQSWQNASRCSRVTVFCFAFFASFCVVVVGLKSIKN